MPLTNYERETIINFNEGESIARIFTYNKTWQKHLEGKLGLKPTFDNGFGGRGYELPKKKIKPPRASRRLSTEARKKLVERGRALHQKSNLSPRAQVITTKSEDKN